MHVAVLLHSSALTGVAVRSELDAVATHLASLNNGDEHYAMSCIHSDGKHGVIVADQRDLVGAHMYNDMTQTLFA